MPAGNSGLAPSSTSTPEEQAASFKHQLEKLALPLLALRLAAESLWTMQLHLMKLQQEIQAAIGQEKAQARRERRPAATVPLTDALWHARRFGDTLAWLLFKRDRRQIYPLTENQKNPVSVDGHGLRGMTAIAETIASTGHGFPLIHEVTDLLRVGDVTFFSNDRPPHTVEVKTQVLQEEHDGVGIRFKYNVTAAWPAEGPTSEDVTPRLNLPKERGPRWRHRSLANARFARQLERMTKAQTLSTAEANAPIDVGGKKTLVVEASGPPPPSHWPLVQRIARRARRTGYATETVDGAIIYLALYSAEPSASAHDLLSSFPGDLNASGILFKDGESGWNALTIFGLPDPKLGGPAMFLPYFLYPLPRSAIFDLLHGRLALVAVVNIGRIAAALEAEGFRVSFGTARRPLRVTTSIEVEGRPFGFDLDAVVHTALVEMVMECRSIAYVIGIAKAAREKVILHFPQLTATAPAGRTGT